MFSLTASHSGTPPVRERFFFTSLPKLLLQPPEAGDRNLCGRVKLEGKAGVKTILNGFQKEA